MIKQKRAEIKKFFLSIVIPIYNEETLLGESINRIKEVLDKNKYDYEFVLVDDGSVDDTWKELLSLAQTLKNSKIIKLSRNFGKEAAIHAGLSRSKGDAVVVMDADLQHPPEYIQEMVSLWLTGNYDVIDAVKDNKKTGRFLSNVFYKIFCKLVGINLTNASDFKLLDKRVVDELERMRERRTFFRAMSFWVGFRRTSIKFVPGDRLKGKSKWSFLSLFKLALDAITSFSPVPLYLIICFGLFFLLLSIILGVHTLYMRYVGFSLDGFTTVILLLLITGSFIMISLGIVGIYIVRIYEEVKGRPRYIVSDFLEKTS